PLDLLPGCRFPRRTAAITPRRGTTQPDLDRRPAVGRRPVFDLRADLLGPPPRERHARVLAERPAAGHAVVADADVDGTGRGGAHRHADERTPRVLPGIADRLQHD